jgi:hypothetical protein
MNDATVSDPNGDQAMVAGRPKDGFEVVMECPLLADVVVKVFLGWRTKILRAADAHHARRRGELCRFIQNRSRTSGVL